MLKIDFFEEKMGLSVVLSNLNAGNNKLVYPTSQKHKTLEILIKVDVLRIF